MKHISRLSERWGSLDAYKQLVKALERGDKIIITTLQKFGFVGELAKIPGKRFAVVVDEAHSSQTGEGVKDLHLVLTSDEQLKEALKKDDESREVDDPIESELEKIQKARQKLPHLTFFAFTATPKDKTLELFGVKDASVKKGFRPFHQYTMRQAIAEGFILDVLESYTTYKTYFELIETEKAEGDKKVEKLKARRLMLHYVDQHPFAIKRKAHIIVDHFTRNTAHKIAGQAKAMVVTLATEHKGTKDYEKLKAEAKDKFRKGTARYVKQYSFISQIMTFTETALEKFYLFAKLLLRQLPYEKRTLPLEVIEMIDMDKYRAQEEQNGRITLKGEDGVLKLTSDDGYRGLEAEKEKIKNIIQKLNKDYGISFEEADRVVGAIKQKLEKDEALRAAFKTNSIEFLRRQKLQDSIKEAFLSNADEFLSFMSKTETDTGFGKFFFSEMFNWYDQTVSEKPSVTPPP